MDIGSRISDVILDKLKKMSENVDMDEKYIKQNENDVLLPAIQKVGCFFRSCLNAVERELHVTLSTVQLNALWDKCKVIGLIDSDDCLMSGAKLMNLAADFVHIPAKFAEIGLKVGKHYEPYLWAEKAGLKPTIFIRKFNQNGPSKYHYVLADENDNLLWDPHIPAIIDRGEVFTICFCRIA